MRIGLNSNQKPKLTKITDSLANVKIIKYDSLANLLIPQQQQQQLKYFQSQNISISNNQNYKTYGFNLDLVSSFSSSNGLQGGKGMSTVAYQYGYYSCSKIQGRGACSFSSIKYKNVENDLTFVDEFYTQFPLSSFIKSKTSYAPPNNLLFNKTFSYTLRNTSYGSNGVVYEALLTGKKDDYYDLNTGVYLKTEITSISYDSWGNAFYTIENITDAVNTNFSKVTSLVYNYTSANLNNWYLNQMISKIETVTTQSLLDTSQIDSKTIDQYFVYDFARRVLNQKTYLPNQDIGYLQLYAYDKNGNLMSTSTKDLTSLEFRNTSLSYDANGLNVIVSQNEMGQKTMYTYDLKDLLVTQIDPNNVNIINVYNIQGRTIYFYSLFPFIRFNLTKKRHRLFKILH